MLQKCLSLRLAAFSAVYLAVALLFATPQAVFADTEQTIEQQAAETAEKDWRVGVGLGKLGSTNKKEWRRLFVDGNSHHHEVSVAWQPARWGAALTYGGGSAYAAVSDLEVSVERTFTALLLTYEAPLVRRLPVVDRLNLRIGLGAIYSITTVELDDGVVEQFHESKTGGAQAELGLWMPTAIGVMFSLSYQARQAPVELDGLGVDMNDLNYTWIGGAHYAF